MVRYHLSSKRDAVNLALRLLAAEPLLARHTPLLVAA